MSKKVAIEIFDHNDYTLENIGSIVDQISFSGDAIINSTSSISCLDAWFREYVGSDHFASMSSNIKQEALDTFLKLRELLQLMRDNLVEKQ